MISETRDYWQRNLAALWFAQFTAILGFSFVFPFLPLYLRADLGVNSTSELAIWTGVSAGVSGLSMAVMAPIWGLVADRYGRKAMLLRAMLAGGTLVGFMGLARGPLDLTVLRFLQGAVSGTVPAVTALVATETPRNRVGWALGVVTSAVAVGSSAGPLVGGVAANLFGLRPLFLVGGALLVLAAVPVFLLVRETPLTARGDDQRSTLSLIRARGPGTLAAIVVLLTCIGLMQTGYTGFQPLVVLRLLEFLQSGVSAVTGVTFAISGLAAAAGAVAYASLARRIGYVRVVVVASLIEAAAFAVAGLFPAAIGVVAAAGLAGLFYGAISPGLASMLGLEAPPAVQARVFGASASATAVGFGLGPLLGGGLAAALGVGRGMIMVAVFPVLLALLLIAQGREPAR